MKEEDLRKKHMFNQYQLIKDRRTYWAWEVKKLLEEPLRRSAGKAQVSGMGMGSSCVCHGGDIPQHMAEKTQLLAYGGELPVLR